MSETNKPLVVILDGIGRTIVGKQRSTTATTLTLENPSIIHVQPNQSTNQLQLQLIPIFFKEFLSDMSVPTAWTYDKSSISIAEDMSFNPQFLNQYEAMWRVAPAASSEPEVVKLFDE